MNTALNQVLEDAQNAANAYVPPIANNNQALSLVQPTNTALAPLGKPSMSDFVNSGGMVVDHYIAVKPASVRVGEMKGSLDRIPVTIDMLDITPLYVCRVEVGGNTVFIKSYNGQTTAQGEDFQQLVALKTRQSGAKSSGIYQTVEIPCELAEDLKDPKSALTVEIGTTLGFTPSLTGFKEFQSFYKKLERSNPELLQSNLRIDLVTKQRSNKNNNEWFVLELELVGVA